MTKYENLVEPSRTSRARFSYFFQSHCQYLPDFHTFSVSQSQLSTIEKKKNLVLKCPIPSEPERAAEARRAVAASFFNNRMGCMNQPLGASYRSGPRCGTERPGQCKTPGMPLPIWDGPWAVGEGLFSDRR